MRGGMQAYEDLFIDLDGITMDALTLHVDTLEGARVGFRLFPSILPVL
jgi:hypothetical protein